MGSKSVRSGRLLLPRSLECLQRLIERRRRVVNRFSKERSKVNSLV